MIQGIRRFIVAIMLRSFATILVVVGVATEAHAQNRIRLSQYAHSEWRVQDGYFSGSPQLITQTTDGYMWIGTSTGVVRFDGAKFESRIPGDTSPSSLSIHVSALYGSRDGSLWIGSRAGIFRLKDGKLVAVDSRQGNVEQIIEDRAGSIWFVRTNTSIATFCQYVANEVRCFDQPDGVQNPNAGELMVGADDSIWLGGSYGLSRWDRQSSRSQTFLARELSATRGLSGVQAIAKAPNGSVWVGMLRGGRGLGLQEIKGDAISPVSLHGIDASRLNVHALLQDRSKTMWVGLRDEGIYRVANGKVDRFSKADGLTGSTVHALYEDREGNVWAATPEGIDCFRQLPMLTFSAREGVAGYQASSVLATHDGSVWVGTTGGLTAIYNNDVSTITPEKGLPGSVVTSMMQGRDGRLWVGVDRELFVRDGGRFVRIPRRDGTGVGIVQDIVEDRDGDVWFVTPRSANVPRKLQRVQGLTAVDELAQPQLPTGAFALAADPERGIWIGTDRGFVRYHDGESQTVSFPLQETSYVRQFVVAPDGAVFGATDNGVLAWRQGILRTLTTKNGLPCHQAHGMVFDQRGALWLYSGCGLLRVEASELQKWWGSEAAVIKATSFGSVDGVRPARATFAPHASRSADGRLWFANDNDVQVIDPIRLAEHSLPPPVHIQRVIADRRDYTVAGPIYLPPLNRDLEIQFAGLSFVAPQKVNFRYLLEGRDTEWQDAGTRRQALYTDLRPGNYRFRVSAQNNAGVWNEEGAALEIWIAPAWYQTWWFLILALALAATALWLLYRRRISQVSRELNARFDERLAERTRLARDLHDTLLQTVEGSKLVADDALSSPEGSVDLRNAMQQVSSWLGQASTEGRAAVSALRGPTSDVDNLPDAFRRAIEDCRRQGPIAGVVSVIGAPREVHPLVRDELYRIGYEAIRNACLHSKAKRLEVTVAFGQDLVIRVVDDGVGIDADLAARGKDGHFGVTGMRERAAKVGATLLFSQPLGGGTEVTVSLPGRIAFQKPTAGR